MQAERTLGLLRLATGLSLILALVNHLLPPKPFALTQLMFDYSQGLTRRGLVGELSQLVLGAEISHAEAFFLAAFVTLIGALSFYLFLVRVLPAEMISGWLLVILALNSFAFASFVGNVGYLDGLLLALTLLAISLPVTLAGLVLRALLVVAGVMIHENMLPYFTLLIGFDLWQRRGNARFGAAIALMPVMLGLLALFVLVGFSKLDVNSAEAFAAGLEARADFWLDPTALEVSGRGISGNLALMAELRGTTKYWAWALFDGVPLLAMSLWLIWLSARLLDTPFGRVLAALVILAPLSLNLIAFDVVRFGAASVLVGFVVIALLLRDSEPARRLFPRLFGWPHMLVLLVLNVNIFTIQVNIGAFHVGQFPWVLLTQLKWLVP